MKKWKLGVATVAAIAALGLAGCSNNQGSSNTKNVTMWVHVSNTDPEGKALQKTLMTLTKKTNMVIKPRFNLFLVPVQVVVMKIK